MKLPDYSKYPPMKYSDVIKGTLLICIYDTEEVYNYAGMTFCVDSVSSYTDTIDLSECGVRGGTSGGWRLDFLNGVTEKNDTYSLRMIPLNWLSEEELFYFRMSGEIPK